MATSSINITPAINSDMVIPSRMDVPELAELAQSCHPYVARYIRNTCAFRELAAIKAAIMPTLNTQSFSFTHTNQHGQFYTWTITAPYKGQFTSAWHYLKSPLLYNVPDHYDQDTIAFWITDLRQRAMLMFSILNTEVPKASRADLDQRHLDMFQTILQELPLLSQSVHRNWTELYSAIQGTRVEESFLSNYHFMERFNLIVHTHRDVLKLAFQLQFDCLRQCRQLIAPTTVSWEYVHAIIQRVLTFYKGETHTLNTKTHFTLVISNLHRTASIALAHNIMHQAEKLLLPRDSTLITDHPGTATHYQLIP